MLSIVIRITLALEVLLVCGEGAVPGASAYLPLGHSNLAQLGLMLGVAVVGVDLWQSIKRLFK